MEQVLVVRELRQSDRRGEKIRAEASRLLETQDIGDRVLPLRDGEPLDSRVDGRSVERHRARAGNGPRPAACTRRAPLAASEAPLAASGAPLAASGSTGAAARGTTSARRAATTPNIPGTSVPGLGRRRATARERRRGEDEDQERKPPSALGSSGHSNALLPHLQIFPPPKPLIGRRSLEGQKSIPAPRIGHRLPRLGLPATWNRTQQPISHVLGSRTGHRWLVSPY